MTNEWKKRAQCRSAPTELFVSPDGAEESVYPSKEALAYCNVCTVKVECLQYALEHDEIGVWGGQSTYQRKQEQRGLDRMKCPGCGSDVLIYENNVQLCLACGVSWPII